MARKNADRLGEAVVERDQRNRTERNVTDSVWQEVARYVIPRDATFLDEIVPGVQRNRFVLDSTAPRSLEMFASFLHTLLNNPSTQWFEIGPLGVPEQDLAITSRQWFEMAQSTMLQNMVGPAANLYSNLHTSYLGLGAFGTAVLYVEGDEDGILRTRTFHMGDITIEEDVSGIVDAVFRQTRMNLRQAQQRWPTVDKDDFGPAFNKSEKRAPANQVVRVLHAVFPTSDRNMMEMLTQRQRNAVEGAPFVSVWVNAEDRITIQVGSFEEMPYMVPRWYKTRGEIYGRSPAMTVLPDVRMTNRMMETILRGAEKIVDPPLFMRDGGLVSPVRLFSGGITFTDGDIDPKPLIPPGASRIDMGVELLAQRQQAIREGFFTPLFLTPDSPVKTATQVLQEVDERNQAISPMLIRLQHELFHPLIARVFGVLSRAGIIPPPPPELDGVELQINYVSPLFASQKQIEALGTLRIIESLLPWTNVDGTILDRFDPGEVAEVVHGGSGAPDRILRSEADFKRVVEARREAALQQQQLEQLRAAVETGAKVQTAQAAQTRADKA